MQKEHHSSITCSNCQIQIEKNYCSECGQFYNPKRLSAGSLISDFIETFFALNKSYALNAKQLLLRPRFVVENYWSGYRNFYFSPNRMLLISTLFLAIYLYFSDNSFLGIQFDLGNYFPWLGIQFFITVLCLFFFSLSTVIVYFKKKKNVFEHLALNAYILSLSISVFLILSVSLKYVNLANYLQFLFTIFIVLWIARVFEKKWWKIIGMAAMNLIVFLALTGGFVLLIQKIQEVLLS